MKIKRLNITDFGIFRNQCLDEISPGLVVIGGPNRAGKTTLLNILRYLWFGFKNKNILPPAVRKHEVEADIILENGEEINLYLEGQAEPRISRMANEGDKPRLAGELFPVDLFTYHRLFTIDLDELRRVPEGVDNSKNLQSVLLGAGLGDILLLPGIEEELFKEAKKIGGKKGNPNVGIFKEYYRQIKDGIRIKTEALGQVEEYQNKKKELKEVQGKIEVIEKVQLPELKNRETVLDVLKNNYDDFEEKERLKLILSDSEARDLLENFPVQYVERVSNLKEKLQKAAEELSNQYSQFRKIVTDRNVQEIKERLLNHKNRIKHFLGQISGLDFRVKDYLKELDKLREEKSRLLLQLQQINASWNDFSSLKEIRTDLVEADKLEINISLYSELQKEQKEINKEVEELTKEKEFVKEQLKPVSAGPEKGLKRFFAMALIMALGGIILSFFHNTAGLIFGVAGVVGSGLYCWARIFLEREEVKKEKQLKLQLDDIEKRLSAGESKLKEIQEKILKPEKELHRYRNLLGLKPDVSPDMVRMRFERVNNLKHEQSRWEIWGQELAEKAVELNQNLAELVKLLEVFKELIDIDVIRKFHDANSLEVRVKSGGSLFAVLENLNQYLEIAFKLEEKEKEVLGIKEEIRELLNLEVSDDYLLEELNDYLDKAKKFNQFKEIESRYQKLKLSVLSKLELDRVKQAFEGLFEKEDNGSFKNPLRLFNELFNNYISREDVEKDYQKTGEKLRELEEELEELKRKEQSLQDILYELATTKKLEGAQKQIDRARAGMAFWAEKYAVNQAGMYILGQVRQRFLERTREELLNPASRLMEKITDGEYSQILPPEELVKTDFQLVLRDGRKQETVDDLSRGTKEQLFLAVRVSRLREIEPPLPVIIDDSLVNFDMCHLEKTIDILVELASTHQVFLLTCHPHLVELIGSKAADAQYWELVRGEFTLSGKEGLMGKLSG